MPIRRPLVSFILALAATALGAQTFVLQPNATIAVTESHTVPLAQDAKLAIRNVNGRIRVEAWDRAEVSFTGQFKPSSHQEQVKVVFESSPGGLEIRGEQPKRAGGESGQSAVCEMDLKVPRGVAAHLDTVNGRITLVGLAGKTDCTTVNGAIEVQGLTQGLKAETVNGAIALDQVRGGIRARTTNGAITAKGLDGLGQGVEISTVNGAVNVTMAKLEGSLDASTVHGQLSVNTKGASHVDATKHRVEATFPGAPQTIRISTVNGAVVVK